VSCTLHNPSQYGLTFKINGIIGLIYGQLNAEIRLDYRLCSMPNRSIVKNQAAPCVHTAWEQSGGMTVGSLKTSTFLPHTVWYS
jgi:hypothetical protein